MKPSKAYFNYAPQYCCIYYCRGVPVSTVVLHTKPTMLQRRSTAPLVLFELPLAVTPPLPPATHTHTNTPAVSHRRCRRCRVGVISTLFCCRIFRPTIRLPLWRRPASRTRCLTSPPAVGPASSSWRARSCRGSTPSRIKWHDQWNACIC